MTTSTTTTWAAGRIVSCAGGRLTLSLADGWGVLHFRLGAHLRARADQAMAEGRDVEILGGLGPRGPYAVSILWEEGTGHE